MQVPYSARQTHCAPKQKLSCFLWACQQYPVKLSISGSAMLNFVNKRIGSWWIPQGNWPFWRMGRKYLDIYLGRRLNLYYQRKFCIADAISCTHRNKHGLWLNHVVGNEQKMVSLIVLTAKLSQKLKLSQKACAKTNPWSGFRAPGPHGTRVM